MQINRLFQIVYILINKKTVTAKELANKLEVSARTIYRDIDILSSCNIPIFMTKGKGGGITLLDNFILNKTLLNEEEQSEILNALENFKLADNSSLLGKMETVFNKNSSNWIEIDFSSWGQNNNEVFDTLKKAILQKKIISFDYFSTFGEKTQRVVYPLQIWFKNRSWYLKAYCKNKGYRIFKCTRIKNLTLSDEEFHEKFEFKHEEKTSSHRPETEVLLEISSNLSYRIFDEFSEEQITKLNEEKYLVKFSYPEDSWVYGYILSFGFNAKVISPPHIKAVIIRELEKNLENYK